MTYFFILTSQDFCSLWFLMVFVNNYFLFITLVMLSLTSWCAVIHENNCCPLLYVVTTASFVLCCSFPKCVILLREWTQHSLLWSWPSVAHTSIIDMSLMITCGVWLAVCENTLNPNDSVVLCFVFGPQWQEHLCGKTKQLRWFTSCQTLLQSVTCSSTVTFTGAFVWYLHNVSYFQGRPWTLLLLPFFLLPQGPPPVGSTGPGGFSSYG